MSSIFDFLNDVCDLKKDILSEDNQGELNMFFLNRWLSMRVDTIMYAQEMNKNSHLPKRMQYDFYLHSIKKSRRKFHYIKHSKQEEIDVVMEYHGCNETRAKELLPLFSADDFSYMKSRLFRGGK